jgi:hypothetical protein
MGYRLGPYGDWSHPLFGYYSAQPKAPLEAAPNVADAPSAGPSRPECLGDVSDECLAGIALEHVYQCLTRAPE